MLFESIIRYQGDHSFDSIVLICSRGFAGVLKDVVLRCDRVSFIYDLDRVHHFGYQSKYHQQLANEKHKINDFISSISNSSWCLYIPHALDNWTRLLASLPSINSIHFFEEGAKVDYFQYSYYFLPYTIDIPKSPKIPQLLPELDSSIEFQNHNYIFSDRTNVKTKSSLLFASQDLSQVHFPKIIFDISYLKEISCAFIERNSHLDLCPTLSPNEKFCLLFGSKHFSDPVVFNEILSQISAVKGSDCKILYKPHPSCQLHHLPDFHKALKHVNIITLTCMFPSDQILFSGNLVCPIYGNTSSILLCANSLGYEVNLLGKLRDNPNIARSSNIQNLFSNGL